MMDETAEINYAWARALFDGLSGAGVRRVVLSPGSRSTPLALAAARHPALRIQVVLDERGAAFFALGAARATGAPVALVATSGSAVSEWLPGVTEADLARVPLILLSADRPPELRQCGANQTIDQPGLFGSRSRFSLELPLPERALLPTACRAATQAVAAARWPLPGPVHLNVPLREPLTPGREGPPLTVRTARVSRPLLQPDPGHLDELAGRISGRPGLIVCGPEAGEPLPAGAIAGLAAACDAPLLVDPLSNLRCGTHDRSRVIADYDACLRRQRFRQTAAPEWVLRFGAMPVSKVLGEFLHGLPGGEMILVDPHGRWPDPLQRASDMFQADPAAVARELARRVRPMPGGYLAAWRARATAAAAVVAGRLPAEGRLIRELGARLPPETRLFSGNSLAVRQLDWFLEGRCEPLRIVCNRGASGIDGNLATLLGIASDGAAPTVGLIGDLTLAHDIGALAEAAAARAVILVLDNGGGAIFDHLPQSALPEHEALFTTPRRFDLRATAGAFGLGYRESAPQTLAGDLAWALEHASSTLLHVPIGRARSLEQHRRLWEGLAN
ncbi:MAG: 2-succinyl-5-enolpyruvyl-6-hydroxy-3-cyclohexene-1-carboxylic-acid synthase [gamma proteobacterium symbiont of Phacoides pectinatus]